MHLLHHFDVCLKQKSINANEFQTKLIEINLNESSIITWTERWLQIDSLNLKLYVAAKAESINVEKGGVQYVSRYSLYPPDRDTCTYQTVWRENF